MKITTFEVWMMQVEMLVADEFGCSTDDLPDMSYWDEWDAGTNPSGMLALIWKDYDMG